MLAQDPSSGQDCLLIGFYGHPETSKRSGSWSLLKALNPNPNLRWFCFDYFNEITYQGEKQGEPIFDPSG